LTQQQHRILRKLARRLGYKLRDDRDICENGTRFVRDRSILHIPSPDGCVRYYSSDYTVDPVDLNWKDAVVFLTTALLTNKETY